MAVWQELRDTAHNVLRDMSVTQRWSIFMVGATVAIALSMMIWLGSQAEETGNLPLPLRVHPRDYEQIEQVLREAGIHPEYDRKEQVISVPVAERDDAYMLLASKQMFTEDSFVGFEEMLGKMDYTVDDLKRRDMMLIAKQNELAKMIGSLDVIEAATVIFAGGKRKFLIEPSPPRASVTVKTALGKKLTQPIAETIIALVAGSTSGLDKRRVHVADQAGRHFYARSEDDPSYMAVDRLKQQREEALRKQEAIEHLVRTYIPGCEAYAFVTLELDLDTHKSERRTVLEGPVKRVVTSKEESESTRLPSGPTGTQPNVVRVQNETAGVSERDTRTKKESAKDFENGYFLEQEAKATGKVEDMDISVVIHLPQSSEVDDESKVRKQESVPALEGQDLVKLQRAIARSVKHEDYQRIEVQQVAWQAPVQKEEERLTALMVVAALAKHLPTLILAGFVAVGLLVMWGQVRRVIPAEELSTLEEEISAPAPTEFSEMSEEERANANFEQMRRRVGDIINEDPKKAASLVRRWLISE